MSLGRYVEVFVLRQRTLQILKVSKLDGTTYMAQGLYNASLGLSNIVEW